MDKSGASFVAPLEIGDCWLSGWKMDNEVSYAHTINYYCLPSDPSAKGGVQVCFLTLCCFILFYRNRSENWHMSHEEDVDERPTRVLKVFGGAQSKTCLDKVAFRCPWIPNRFEHSHMSHETHVPAQRILSSRHSCSLLTLSLTLSPPSPASPQSSFVSRRICLLTFSLPHIHPSSRTPSPLAPKHATNMHYTSAKHAPNIPQTRSKHVPELPQTCPQDSPNMHPRWTEYSSNM